MVIKRFQDCCLKPLGHLSVFFEVIQLDSAPVAEGHERGSAKLNRVEWRRVWGSNPQDPLRGRSLANCCLTIRRNPP